jgi:Na+-translocating ferredoxin:NAD+ oxidoreductase RnfD subunit
VNDAERVGYWGRVDAARRLLRKPKELLIVVLAVDGVIAGLHNGFSLVAPSLAGAICVAMAIDAPLLRWTKGRWTFPDGALLTGMIVAMIISPRERWYVATVTSAIGVVSKYVFRIRTTNIFNPAALALVATFYLFHPGQDWWGAIPGKPLVALLLLITAGVYVTNRVNKFPALLSFLGSYFLLFTISAFVGDPAKIVEIYREPDVYAVLFFAFFMVTDPPTSPPKSRDQLVFGLIVAAASCAAFEWMGAAHFFLVGLLVGNLWEAARRTATRSRTHVGVTGESV